MRIQTANMTHHIDNNSTMHTQAQRRELVPDVWQVRKDEPKQYYLQQNPSCHMRMNSITAEQLEELRLSLSQRAGLKNLSIMGLCSHVMGDALAEMVALVLTANPSIRTLRLDGNHITSAGAMRLAQAIQARGGLDLLSIENNSIQDMGKNSLSELMSSGVLKTCYLSGNSTLSEQMKRGFLVPVKVFLLPFTLLAYAFGGRGGHHVPALAGLQEDFRKLNGD